MTITEGAATLLSFSAWLVAVILLALAVFWLWPRTPAAGPQVGDTAPPFSLVDQDGTIHNLSDYRGQWLVLYFYPKDDTPGCTTEACHFRDDYARIRALGAAVIGVSLDDVSSHKAFADKYHLPFPLLADADHKVAAAYGVLTKAGPLIFAARQTFVIDPQGNIVNHYKKVDSKAHAAEILDFLKQQTGK